MSQSLDLGSLGLTDLKRVYWNLPAPALYEEALKREEGVLAAHGPLIVRTGTHTGRSPNDKFTVKEDTSSDSIWWGKVNIPFDENRFESLYRRMQAYFKGKDVFVQDVFAGADPTYQIPIRVVTEKAWHNLFAQNLLIRADLAKPHENPFTVIAAPGFQAIPEQDGTNSETFIIVDFKRRLVLIGGSRYAGEIKKSIFFLLNYLLPKQNVMSMHCSANIGKEGDVAVFFGLSGTGKTTLSADPERRLIGDDEHGWSDKGVFNFEGGCYAKTIRLSQEAEPEIFATTRMFGTVLENVGYDEDTRILDLDDDTLTENTRAGYPLTHLTNIEPSGIGGHPKHIVMLTADAFGVLPPISKLSPEQAMYHFLSGYTAKVAGTERGIKEPQATFSTCFGAPFMALHPTVYAKMLGEKIAQHKTDCWLVNTGWSGGPYGTGSRIKIAYTRALLRAALNGSLKNVPFETDAFFGLSIPTRCDGVPAELLNPRNTWADKKAYDEMANHLAKRFHENIDQFEGQVPEEILAAGPRGVALV